MSSLVNMKLGAHAAINAGLFYIHMKDEALETPVGKEAKNMAQDIYG
jgi:hypothetical protein